MDSPWMPLPEIPAWPPIPTTAPLPPEEFEGKDSVSTESSTEESDNCPDAGRLSGRRAKGELRCT
jgi:hypothetical protein